jgi:hypothetical protein
MRGVCGFDCRSAAPGGTLSTGVLPSPANVMGAAVLLEEEEPDHIG